MRHGAGAYLRMEASVNQPPPFACKPGRALALLLAICVLAGPAAARQEDVRAWLDKARSALGIGSAPASTVWTWRGEGEALGSPVTCELAFSEDGRFRMRSEGRTGSESGLDDARAWHARGSEGARTLVLEDREISLLGTWFVTGTWLAQGLPLEIGLSKEAFPEGQVRLEVRMRDGLRPATVTLDRASARPLSLECASAFGGETWSLADWTSDAGRARPATIEHRFSAGLTDIYRYGEAQRSVPASDAGFGPSRGAPIDARFDAEAPARLEVQRLASGHLLVHPTLQGQDVGWFVFDTGAAVSVIDREAAEALGLAPYGKAFLGGAGAEQIQSRLFDVETLELGPLTIERLQFFEMRSDLLDALRGPRIAGVIGYDVLHRVVAAVRMSEPRIELYEPGRYALEGAQWSNLLLHTRHPVVSARYEGREGLFRIDTGAGAVTVMFNAPTVEKKKLLEGREVREASALGVGGSIALKIGALADFELAGHRIERTGAIFSAPGAGATEDPYTDGILGGGIIGRFEMVLDYQHERLAWKPLAE